MQYKQWVTGFKLILILLSGGLFPGISEATTFTVGHTFDPRLGSEVVQTARDMLGTPYRWAGTSSRGVDCSGLVFYVYKKAASLPLPRGVKELIKEGVKVDGPLQEGDLVFFATMSGPAASHVGISLGGKVFIHAASAGKDKGVIISSLDEGYYKSRYLGARRLLPEASLKITIKLDNNPLETTFSAQLDPQSQVFVHVVNNLPDADTLQFRVRRQGKRDLSRRLKGEKDKAFMETFFVPETGNWTIILSDDIKRELVSISFSGKNGGT